MTVNPEITSPDSPPSRLFGRNFLLICMVSLASTMGFQFLLPTLPLYLKTLGGQDAEIGLILGIYSVSVLAARFISGWAMERWGLKRLLVAGAFLYLVAMLLYNVTDTVSSILALRLFHGLGFGLVTTACWAIAAELAPPSRRGEALGYFGNFGSVAMALGPGIALWLISAPDLALSGFPMLFAACAGAGTLELLLTFFLADGQRNAMRVAGTSGGQTIRGLFCREAMPFAITMLFGAFGIGAILSFVPIRLAGESAQNISVFFFVYAATMTFSRPFIGILSDRIERRLVAAPLMGVCAVGVGIIAISPSLPAVLASAIICGIGFGSLQPTLLALVVDATEPRQRGAALATFMSAIDVGIALGSTLLGLIAQAAGYASVFVIAAVFVSLGLIYFAAYQRLSSPRAPKRSTPAVPR